MQTCVVHLIRAANRFVSYGDRKAVSRSLRAIYTTLTEDAAATALEDFAASSLGQKYPAFPPALCKVIYTANAIESLNYQLLKVTKNRGHFPTDEAAVKLLWLAIGDIEDKRAAQLAKDQAKKVHTRRQNYPSYRWCRLVEGAGTNSWNQALQHLALTFSERVELYLV